MVTLLFEHHLTNITPTFLFFLIVFPFHFFSLPLFLSQNKIEELSVSASVYCSPFLIVVNATMRQLCCMFWIVKKLSQTIAAVTFLSFILPSYSLHFYISFAGFHHWPHALKPDIDFNSCAGGGEFVKAKWKR